MSTTEAQKKQATQLGYFLAKFLDPATTDAEAAGAVNALVARLRKMHHAGNRDFVLAVLTREEAQLVLEWREGTGPATRPTGAPADDDAEPEDPFYDALNGILEHGMKEAAKAGMGAVAGKIPGLFDDLFKDNRKKPRKEGTG